MSNKQTKKTKKVKRNKRLHIFRFVIFLIIAVVLVVFGTTAIIQLIKNPTNTVILKQGKISKEESAIGYIVRDETVVKGENYKNGMEKIVDEGEKIAKSESIFRYYSSGEEDLVKKIKELDVQIQEAMEKNDNYLFSSDIKMLDNQIDEELKLLKKLNSVQEIQEVKRTLLNYISKKAKISGELSPSGSYLKKLIDERSGYENELASGSEYITSPKGGIVSYRIDGLEETLIPDDFSKYNEKFLNDLNLKTGQIIASSNEQGKIINNFIYYLIFTSKTEEAKNTEVGDKIQVVLPNSKVANAKVEYIINEEDGKVTITLSLTEGIEDLSMYRKNVFDIIWWDKQGYKVPNSAIITENNLSFIIRTRMGYLEKVLIKVKKQGDDYSIITNYKNNIY